MRNTIGSDVRGCAAADVPDPVHRGEGRVADAVAVPRGRAGDVPEGFRREARIADAAARRRGAGDVADRTGGHECAVVDAVPSVGAVILADPPSVGAGDVSDAARPGGGRDVVDAVAVRRAAIDAGYGSCPPGARPGGDDGVIERGVVDGPLAAECDALDNADVAAVCLEGAAINRVVEHGTRIDIADVPAHGVEGRIIDAGAAVGDCLDVAYPHSARRRRDDEVALEDRRVVARGIGIDRRLPCPAGGRVIDGARAHRIHVADLRPGDEVAGVDRAVVHVHRRVAGAGREVTPHGARSRGDVPDGPARGKAAVVDRRGRWHQAVTGKRRSADRRGRLEHVARAVEGEGGVLRIGVDVPDVPARAHCVERYPPLVRGDVPNVPRGRGDDVAADVAQRVNVPNAPADKYVGFRPRLAALHGYDAVDVEGPAQVHCHHDAGLDEGRRVAAAADESRYRGNVPDRPAGYGRGPLDAQVRRDVPDAGRHCRGAPPQYQPVDPALQHAHVANRPTHRLDLHVGDRCHRRYVPDPARSGQKYAVGDPAAHGRRGRVAGDGPDAPARAHCRVVEEPGRYVADVPRHRFDLPAEWRRRLRKQYVADVPGQGLDGAGKRRPAIDDDAPDAAGGRLEQPGEVPVHAHGPEARRLRGAQQRAGQRKPANRPARRYISHQVVGVELPDRPGRGDVRQHVVEESRSQRSHADRRQHVAESRVDRTQRPADGDRPVEVIARRGVVAPVQDQRINGPGDVDVPKINLRHRIIEQPATELGVADIHRDPARQRVTHPVNGPAPGPDAPGNVDVREVRPVHADPAQVGRRVDAPDLDKPGGEYPVGLGDRVNVVARVPIGLHPAGVGGAQGQRLGLDEHVEHGARGRLAVDGDVLDVGVVGRPPVQGNVKPRPGRPANQPHQHRIAPSVDEGDALLIEPAAHAAEKHAALERLEVGLPGRGNLHGRPKGLTLILRRLRRRLGQSFAGRFDEFFEHPSHLGILCISGFGVGSIRHVLVIARKTGPKDRNASRQW